ncbi:MAG: hypothetical protein ABI876_00900 [Bacteroidota bacterium]
MQAPASYIIPISVTLSVRDATVQTNIQIPDGGFRILRFIPHGFVAAKLLVPPERDTASDIITVSWKCEQDRLGSTDGSISFWSLAALHESPLWSGEWFAERKKLLFEFKVTSDRSGLTIPATVGYDIWGLIGSEQDTLDYVRYNGYRSLQGTPLLTRLGTRP